LPAEDRNERGGLLGDVDSVLLPELLSLFDPTVLDHLVNLVTVGELGALLEPTSGEDDEDGRDGGHNEAERPPADGEQQVDGTGSQYGAHRPAGLDERVDETAASGLGGIAVVSEHLVEIGRVDGLFGVAKAGQ